MERLTCTEAAEGFQFFWAQYPVKQNKMAAERLWRTMHLMNELTAELVETILKAVRVQCKWEQWRNGFIPAPDRWLANRRWEDEERPKANYGKPDRGRVVLNTFNPSTPLPETVEEIRQRNRK